jgi:hypothetical protein
MSNKLILKFKCLDIKFLTNKYKIFFVCLLFDEKKFYWVGF